MFEADGRASPVFYQVLSVADNLRFACEELSVEAQKERLAAKRFADEQNMLTIESQTADQIENPEDEQEQNDAPALSMSM